MGLSTLLLSLFTLAAGPMALFRSVGLAISLLPGMAPIAPIGPVAPMAPSRDLLGIGEHRLQ